MPLPPLLEGTAVDVAWQTLMTGDSQSDSNSDMGVTVIDGAMNGKSREMGLFRHLGTMPPRARNTPAGDFEGGNIGESRFMGGDPRRIPFQELSALFSPAEIAEDLLRRCASLREIGVQGRPCGSSFEDAWPRTADSAVEISRFGVGLWSDGRRTMTGCGDVL
jgi:hypothetical protein